jgi:hypothetical protein
MKMFPRALLASAALVALATPASAVTYVFTLSNGLTGSWQLPASPVPDVVLAGAFRINTVTGILNGNPFTAFMEFYETGGGGGVCASEGLGCGLLDLYGPQLFTGTTAAPTFTLGSFEMTNAFGAPLATLTIAEASAGIPEPATWAMLIAGFGLVGTGLRRRRQHVAA